MDGYSLYQELVVALFLRFFTFPIRLFTLLPDSSLPFTLFMHPLNTLIDCYKSANIFPNLPL